jgi:DNA-binding NarL/FixJ family response regulator
MSTSTQAAAGIRVFIVEDKEIMRSGLMQLVEGIDGCWVIGDANDGKKAVEAILEARPAVVLLKRDIPGIGGVEASKQIKQRDPGIGVILLLNSADDFWTSLDSRADAYFFREMPIYVLQAAIQTVAEGGAFLGSIVADYLLRGPGLEMLKLSAGRHADVVALSVLSRRENEVLKLLVEGNNNDQMAKLMGLSPQTVKVHVKHILKKLKVSDRTQAVIKAINLGY